MTAVPATCCTLLHHDDMQVQMLQQGLHEHHQTCICLTMHLQRVCRMHKPAKPHAVLRTQYLIRYCSHDPQQFDRLARTHTQMSNLCYKHLQILAIAQLHLLKLQIETINASSGIQQQPIYA